MSTQVKVKLPHFCAPIAYDEYLDKILLAIYKVGKASSSKEIVGKDSSLENHICVGRAASFLSYLGLVEGERSPFDLSTVGRKIAVALAEGKKDVALDLWQQTLKSHSLCSELQKYINAQGGGRGTSLGFAEHLRSMAGEKWATSYSREGGKRICILFANKGLLKFDRDEDSISFPTAGPVPTAPTLPTAPTVPTPTPAPMATPSTLPFTINITVEAKDPESIKQLINLVKELKGRKEELS